MPHGFELLHEQPIPELNSTARLYRHRTGAELLSVENADENKLFGISFRTPPSDSTGLPHIMEHSVLCGSQKYPSKEPFVELIKGSLNTYLNASTSADRTSYPVASTNLQDFYNLVDVYLDAVLHPLIPPQTLQQEGWHYEIEAPDAPLIYKGVVYNEMKGANASPDRLLYMYTQQALLPDTPYRFDSGGIPAQILDLTYEQFKAFHETFYHPANSLIFFYGDDDPAERLRRVDEALRPFEPAPVEAHVPPQPRFERPTRLTQRYPVAEGSDAAKRGMAVVGWLLEEGHDPETLLALQVLNYILLGTPGSPLRKALIESGLGENLAGHGLESHRAQLLFSIGLRGMDPARTEELERLVLDTLTRLAEEGIEPESIKAALNTVEFSLRENNSGSAPRGLVLMQRILPAWVHGGDPIAMLAFEGPLRALAARLDREPRYFEALLRDGLLANQHRVTLTLDPDPALDAELEAAEQARLAEVRAALSEDEIARLVAETHALRAAQEAPDAPEALAAIPCLALDDLARENTPIPSVLSQEAGSTILYHDLPTNGILYLDLGLNLHLLPDELLPYAPLFGRALLEMGTEQEDYVQLSRRIDRTTGGIYSTTLTTTVRAQAEGEAWLMLRGKAMLPQAEALLAILRDVLHGARLDNPDRFLQMVLEAKTSLEAGLLPGGHRLINQRLKAHFSEAHWADEQMSGFAQLLFLRQLAEQVRAEWPTVLATLERLRDTLVNRHGLLVNATVDASGWEATLPPLRAFLAGIPAAPVQPVAWPRPTLPPAEGFSAAAPVNYVGKGADLRALGFTPRGSDLVAARYLSTSWIWERIRVQGGAYAGFSQLDMNAGLFSFLSYRDPNLLATLEVYDRAAEFLRELDLSQEELTKGIIGTIGAYDGYQLPDAKGYTALVRHLARLSDAERQQRREEILATTVADIRAFAEPLAAVREQGQLVILGGREALEKASEALPTPLALTSLS